MSALRARPDIYRFGTGSLTSGGAVLTNALLGRLGLRIVQTSYQSGGKARKALARGDVDLTAGSLNALRKLGDRATPLAVFSPRRLRSWPEVPTIYEALEARDDQAIYDVVYRFSAVPKAFAEAEPEASTKLAEAFRRMTEEDQAFKDDVEARGVGALWLGPLESNVLIRRSHQHFRQLIAQ